MARILVVDDDEDVLDSLEAALDEAGHTAVGARTVERALAASPERFDLLLVDLWMRPGPSGLDLKGELDRKKLSVPFILMSSDDDVALHATRAGCAEYLHKPFSPDQLQAAVNRVMADSPEISSERQAPLVPVPAAPLEEGVADEQNDDGDERD
jgi:DNA-binding NtrC family response regulator